MLEAKEPARLGKAPGPVGRTLVRHQLVALHALAVEPRHSPAHKADRRGLLLVRQYLHVGQPRGVLDGDMHTVVADTAGAPLLTITGDAMPTLRKRASFLTSIWIRSPCVSGS